MNGDLNKQITEFVRANMPESYISPNDIIWLYELFKKTKAQQKADFIAFLNARKAEIATEISNEPTRSSSTVTRLEAEDDIIDNIISTF